MSIPELADITTCVHCGQKFSSPRLTIIGEPTARLESYLKGLSRHLQEKHPQLGQLMVQQGAAFMEFLFLRNFRTTDPELSEQQDRVRWQVHQQTLKARYPDESLRNDAAALGARLCEVFRGYLEECGGITAAEEMHSEITSNVIEAFVSIRDALEEPGKYPVPAPASSKVLA